MSYSDKKEFTLFGIHFETDYDTQFEIIKAVKKRAEWVRWHALDSMIRHVMIAAEDREARVDLERLSTKRAFDLAEAESELTPIVINIIKAHIKD